MSLVTDRQSYAGRFDAEKLDACVRACFDAVCAGTAYADASLSQPTDAEQVPSLRAALDFVDASGAVWRLLTRAGTDDRAVHALLVACAEAGRICAEECARGVTDQMSRTRFAEAAGRCAEACEALRACIVGAAA